MQLNYYDIELPFDIKVRRLYVNVYIGQNKYKGILDTGSQDIILSDNLIEIEKFKKNSNGYYIIPSISFDGVKEYPFYNLNAKNNILNKNLEIEGLDIIIGMNVLLFSEIKIKTDTFTLTTPFK